MAAVLALVVGGLAGCRDRIDPNYTCGLRLAEPPGAVHIHDQVWVRAIAETECDPDNLPHSHHLTLWLERQNKYGHWSDITSENYEEIPGATPRKNVITYAGCQDGRWRLRVVVSGRAATDLEYVYRPGPFEGEVSCS
jgi:hypothetical protein